MSDKDALLHAQRHVEYWRFGPEINYEVGDTFVWAADSRNVYCGTKAAKPFGTYRVTGRTAVRPATLYGKYWYEAELMPEKPMTEEDIREIST